MTSVTTPLGRIVQRVALDPLRATRALGRAGLADPRRAVALSRALARWGASPAAVYQAAALLHPERTAIADDGGVVTFGELDHWTDDLAAGLAARGVGPAARIGLLARNHRGFVASVVTAAKLGADVVYLNTGTSAPQLADVAEREGVTHVFHDAEFAELAATVPHRRWTAVTTDAEHDDAASLALVHFSGTGQPVPRRPRHAALPVLLTSGTTGTPKGARRRHVRPDLTAAGGLLAALPYRVDDTFHVAAPLFHAWGFSQMLVAASLGAPLVLRRRFDPSEVGRVVARHDVTVLVAVPVMLQRILTTVPSHCAPAVLERHDRDGAALARLRVVATSGSALPGRLATEWMDRFGDTLYNLYGSTEVGEATVAGPADLRAAPGTAGRVLPGTRVAVLDTAGRAVPAGAEGRICVASPFQFAGYTGGGTKPVEHGLMDTGDIGHLDAAGRLFVTGRQDDMIVSGGENVFPAEVEDLLAMHPAVLEVAVVGVDDDDLGQRLRAVVVRRRGTRLSASEVRQYVKANLARHKVPRDVVFVDALPRNAAGKVQRASLP